MLEFQTVYDEVKRNYSITPVKIKKVKNVYKIEANEKKFCLKMVKYDIKRFLFILGAIKYLQKNGFEKVPDIIKTIEGKDFIKIDESYAYLTEWVEARECDYDKTSDIVSASKKLAELHKKSMGFTIDSYMEPRVKWLKWFDEITYKIKDMKYFQEIIRSKSKLTNFDVLYQGALREEIERAKYSYKNLKDTDYVESMNKEIKLKGFCHHDYAHHNILIGRKIYIIDFDYCLLDTHLHDLASLLLRKMKYGKWSLHNAVLILDAYNSVYEIKRNDIPIMAAFMEFPQDFWQVGIQYYIEKQPWDEYFFQKKLLRYFQDKDEKQNFIEMFRNFKI